MIIDMHSHLLPKADHGSESLESSIGQCKKAIAAGVEIVVATPHFNIDSDTVDTFLIRREEAYTCLTNLVKYPRVIKAAEVAMYPGIEQLNQLHELCIEGTNYILLEIPYGVGDDWIYESIFEIKARRGLKPIIAHIDRYSKEKTNRLFEMDVMIQVNASAFMRFKEYRYMLNLYRKNKAHVLGSDAHDSVDEYLYFKKACKKLGSLCEIVMGNAERIIHNI